MPNTLTFKTILPTDVPQFSKVLGSNPGRLLQFDNAVLARAEVNKNRDEFTLAELQALANTLPNTAIDLDHNPREVRGYFTAASVQDGAMPTGGFIFADRFPEIAEGVQNGKYFLSIEAHASEAECSVCHGVYASESQYCDHLKNRNVTGAVRKLRGMYAVGGAVTKNPAGTNTKFDQDKISVVASVTHSPEQVLYFENELAYTIWAKTGRVIGKVLDSKERDEMKPGEFALRQKKDGKTVERFPINDCEHARKALQLLPRAKDVSAEERAEIERKAHAKLDSASCKPKSEAQAAVNDLLNSFADAPVNSGHLGEVPGANLSVYRPVVSPQMYVGYQEPFIEEVVARMKAGIKGPIKPTVVASAEKPVEKPENIVIAGFSGIAGISFDRKKPSDDNKMVIVLKKKS